jgi:hypothetical protein
VVVMLVLAQVQVMVGMAVVAQAGLGRRILKRKLTI